MSDYGPIERPVLALRAPDPTATSIRGGGKRKVSVPSRGRQGQRLDSRFAEIERLLKGDASAVVSDALPDTDPELVVVFEVVDETKDLDEAFRRAGLEPLLDVEDDIDDDELGPDFARLAEATSEAESIKRFLHAAMANEAAVAQILKLWRHWKTGNRMLSGFGPFTALFNLLHDVRRWEPRDRIRATGLPDFLEHCREENLAEVPLVIELWYRAAPDVRAAIEQRVREVIERGGGSVLRVRVHPEIGLHALAVTFPAGALDAVAAGSIAELDQIDLLRSPDVLFVRPGGQSVAAEAEPPSEAVEPEESALPEGPPILAMIDGLPAVNHPLLRDRLQIVDPDGLGSDPEYTVGRRVHGTQVASALVWGDLGLGHVASRRPVVVRPVLLPDTRTQKADEAIPWIEIPADLTVRAVRDLIEGGGAPTVKVINLSLGDPLAQFDTIPSSWARAIDWLAHAHNLLFVVSAGNHPGPLPIDASDLQGRFGPAREELTATALAEISPRRRLLPPAESLNALTVGALHADGAGDRYEMGYRLDPWDSVGNPSPMSAQGRGIRRSIKPDIAAPGGRQLYTDSLGGGEIHPARSPAQPPGIRVASPPDRTIYACGTTFAAAEVSRRAVRIIESLTSGELTVGDRYLPVAAKALLQHGARFPGEPPWGLSADRLVGHGPLIRDLALGCEMHQASLLFTGDIGADQQVEIVVPFPPAVAAMRSLRRITLTLAWLSPINWNHRQYRRAKLTVDGPPELPVSTRKPVGPPHRLTIRGTTQQRILETSSVYTADQLTFTVKCAGQAGGFAGTVPFALAVSLEDAAETGVDVYSLVETAVRTRIRL